MSKNNPFILLCVHVAGFAVSCFAAGDLILAQNDCRAGHSNNYKPSPGNLDHAENRALSRGVQKRLRHYSPATKTSGALSGHCVISCFTLESIPSLWQMGIAQWRVVGLRHGSNAVARQQVTNTNGGKIDNKEGVFTSGSGSGEGRRQEHRSPEQCRSMVKTNPVVVLLSARGQNHLNRTQLPPPPTKAMLDFMKQQHTGLNSRKFISLVVPMFLWLHILRSTKSYDDERPQMKMKVCKISQNGKRPQCKVNKILQDDERPQCKVNKILQDDQRSQRKVSKISQND
ncbi:hypothetical protein RRG08_047843 [Elysia crispata]|uniref:Secreted protein n=1 Tax=Elysia crispata TaxID=231223 RepID=A0AAE1DPR9_9GAST|nr:hypothetical protein RRG08_047843 [Elysia crispata]